MSSVYRWNVWQNCLILSTNILKPSALKTPFDRSESVRLSAAHHLAGKRLAGKRLAGNRLAGNRLAPAESVGLASSGHTIDVSTEDFVSPTCPPSGSMNRRLTKVSKYLTFVLRHHPEAIGLQLSPEGWANTETLVQQANAHGKSITLEQVHAVVSSSEEKRFVVSPDGQQIRAI